MKPTEASGEQKQRDATWQAIKSVPPRRILHALRAHLDRLEERMRVVGEGRRWAIQDLREMWSTLVHDVDPMLWLLIGRRETEMAWRHMVAVLPRSDARLAMLIAHSDQDFRPGDAETFAWALYNVKLWSRDQDGRLEASPAESLAVVLHDCQKRSTSEARVSLAMMFPHATEKLEQVEDAELARMIALWAADRPGRPAQKVGGKWVLLAGFFRKLGVGISDEALKKASARYRARRPSDISTRPSSNKARAGAKSGKRKP